MQSFWLTFLKTLGPKEGQPEAAACFRLQTTDTAPEKTHLSFFC